MDVVENNASREHHSIGDILSVNGPSFPGMITLTPIHFVMCDFCDGLEYTPPLLDDQDGFVTLILAKKMKSFFFVC